MLSDIKNCDFKKVLMDAGVLLFIFLAMYYPDRPGVLAKIFSVDAFFAFDGDITAPAWAFYKECLLNIDVSSRYGIGIPILAASFCKILGQFSYENILTFITVMTIVYLWACHRFLVLWIGNRLIVLAGVILILKFRFDDYMDLPVHPGGCILRHFFDIFFFIFLFYHLTRKQFKYLLGAAVSAALALFSMVDSGLYLLASFFVYLFFTDLLPTINGFLVKKISSFKAFIRRVLEILLVMVLPVFLVLILFTLFSQNQLGLFFQNTFEFSKLFRVGFSTILFWENIGNTLPFVLGVVIPILLLLTVCLVTVFVWKGYFPQKHLLTAIIAFYGLGGWHYYVCRPYIGSMYYFIIPALLVLCFWVNLLCEALPERARRAGQVIFIAIALFLSLSTPRFIQAPNLLNLGGNDFKKETAAMKRSFIDEKDILMIRQLTRPDEAVAVLGSFETGYLVKADRRPFFYYTPMFQNAPTDGLGFYMMYTVTKTSLKKTINEILSKKPRYVFMEEKIYERTIREHLPYMFEPMFIMQELAIKPYYRLVQTGKNLVALERKNP